MDLSAAPKNISASPGSFFDASRQVDHDIRGRTASLQSLVRRAFDQDINVLQRLLDHAGADRKGEQRDDRDDEKQPEKGNGGRNKAEGHRGSDKGKDGDQNEDSGKKSRLPIVILIVVAVLVIAGGAIYWFSTRNEESTDDAYTEGNAIGIAPKVSGYVIERSVDDNNFVRAGEVMLRIDPRDYITARDQARANLDLARAQMDSAKIDRDIARVRYPADKMQSQAQLDQARANETNAGREYHRQRTVDQRATTQSTVDQAATQFESTRASTRQVEAQLRVANLVGPNIAATDTALKQRIAQMQQAQAALDQAELNLSYTFIRAPQDGYVTRRNVDVGTFAQAGQQAFYLVSPVTWIVANFKETQLDRMKIGQHVKITVDAYTHLKLRGHIESIQQGSGARFTAFPSENATGNYVKIVRRVPVKIVIDDGIDPRHGLPLGLSVEPTVNLQ